MTPTRLPLLATAALVAALMAAWPTLTADGSPTPNGGGNGSSCQATVLTGGDPGPRADLDSSSLGPAAPAAYEIGAPTSAPEPLPPPRRVMILVHGGGWFLVGPAALRTQRDMATRWRAAGWQTVSVTYRACAKSVRDVARFYDLVRARVGPRIPICLLGQSAGAHLALMVAARRPDVACVLSMGAPTDPRTIRSQGRREATRGTGPAALRKGAAEVERLAVAAFGRKRLRIRSPVALAARIRARLLLATAANDVAIPQGQAKALARAVAAAHHRAYVKVTRLAAGPITFVHGGASAAAIQGFDTRVEALVAPFGRAPPSLGLIQPAAPPGAGP